MYRKRFVVYAIVIVVTLTLFTVQYVKDKADQIKYDQTRQIGEEIVAALLKYKMDKGVYPDELVQLVPNYINSIEQPVWGDCVWSYAP